MCGINGFTWNDSDLIQTMNRISYNRGPDDNGIFVDNSISLGLTRLAIIDLSEKGHQPMSNQDGSIWITFNGEIYNYQSLRNDLVEKGYLFNSNTDTEVIIHAYAEYGLECFHKFNGMWGLGIYDLKKQRLILCRDRFGIKPLYYYQDTNRLIFSSMISTILAHDVETGPNDETLMEYLAFNLEHHDEKTFFSNIFSLLPGHMMVYDLEEKNSHISPWYQPAAAKDNSTTALREKFIESVKYRTIADVPVGVCLSGGIDSTAIASILDKTLSKPFKTFSLVAPGSNLDESKYIEEVVRQTKAQPHYTTVTPKIFLQEIDDFVASIEEPVTGLSPYAQYRVFKLAKENGAKVLLDGQGGDELFAGYNYFFSYYFFDLFVKMQWWKLVRNMVLYKKKLGNFFPHAMFVFLLLPKWLRKRVWKDYITPWVNHEFQQKTSGLMEDPRWARMSIRESLSLTLTSTSVPHLLRWEDKNSMRWSIESRVPFLDHEFVETTLALSPEELITNGETKLKFKEALFSVLPPLIRDRKDKIGFAAPEEEFFRDEVIVEFVKSILYSDSFKNRPYWKWQEVEKVFEAHVQGTRNASRLIWKWINTELWLRTFFGDQTVSEASASQ